MKIKEKADLLLGNFKGWSEQQTHIQGVAVVGSFARGDFHSNSDVDLTIITTNKDLTLNMIKNDFNFGNIESSTLEEWGILTSLRIFYGNGLEVEYGVVTDQWVKEPLDEGTKNVVKNGFKVVTEKENIFYSIKMYLNNL
ncbi:nucleotidyltransferase domain-containing protein [uncultured Metabacillus sp.]|uniref:nucleotidyltransferase domain-containing protein n=1 Tax=uncultured Metabacillus sp. TaxID=2860135 RepID=UPI00262F8E88|nr:nucleotidyltransferase domain-containing protein [uncultured Metabacillus sp.]